jgi:hypothetical protein
MIENDGEDQTSFRESQQQFEALAHGRQGKVMVAPWPMERHVVAGKSEARHSTSRTGCSMSSMLVRKNLDERNVDVKRDAMWGLIYDANDK